MDGIFKLNGVFKIPESVSRPEDFDTFMHNVFNILHNDVKYKMNLKLNLTPKYRFYTSELVPSLTYFTCTVETDSSFNLEHFCTLMRQNRSCCSFGFIQFLVYKSFCKGKIFHQKLPGKHDCELHSSWRHCGSTAQQTWPFWRKEKKDGSIITHNFV